MSAHAKHYIHHLQHQLFVSCAGAMDAAVAAAAKQKRQQLLSIQAAALASLAWLLLQQQSWQQAQQTCQALLQVCTCTLFAFHPFLVCQSPCMFAATT